MYFKIKNELLKHIYNNVKVQKLPYKCTRSRVRT